MNKKNRIYEGGQVDESIEKIGDLSSHDGFFCNYSEAKDALSAVRNYLTNSSTGDKSLTDGLGFAIEEVLIEQTDVGTQLGYRAGFGLAKVVLLVPRHAGETDQEFEQRCEGLLLRGVGTISEGFVRQSVQFYRLLDPVSRKILIEEWANEAE